LYGTHPFHWYLTAGIPALTGILLPVLIYDGISKWDRARRNLWTIVLCYVVTHSWSEHKEFRFLLPVLPIFCLLCGGRIQNIVIGLRPSRIKQIMITFAGINLIAILYLGLFHQRAPVDVNRAILKAVAGTHRNNNNNNKPAADIRVHYLMGCHSTPLLSHLHDPPTKFVPWFLDCSPKCRANPDIDCESVAFSNDPGEFMKQTYNFECTATTEEGDQDGTSCAASSTSDNDSNIMGSRTFPDYVVCYSNDIIEMRAHLELMGMKEIGRFVHGINGIRIGNLLTLGDEGFSNNDFTKIGIFRDSLVVSVEEMILFQKYI
jgi:phosphatidylinositol glycan class B